MLNKRKNSIRRNRSLGTTVLDRIRSKIQTDFMFYADFADKQDLILFNRILSGKDKLSERGKRYLIEVWEKHVNKEFEVSDYKKVIEDFLKTSPKIIADDGEIKYDITDIVTRATDKTLRNAVILNFKIDLPDFKDVEDLDNKLLDIIKGGTNAK